MTEDFNFRGIKMNVLKIEGLRYETAKGELTKLSSCDLDTIRSFVKDNF